MKAITQTATQAITSVVVSVTVSIVASWLLRRLIYTTEQPGTGTEGRQESPVVVVVPTVIVGNVFGPQFVGRRPGGGPFPFGKRLRK